MPASSRLITTRQRPGTFAVERTFCVMTDQSQFDGDVAAGAGPGKAGSLQHLCWASSWVPV